MTPPELDFGDCEIGQHGQTRIAFLFNPWWNQGAATITSISIQGADFAIDSDESTCRSILRIGQLCAIAVRFNPKAGGSRNGKLIVQDNASNSPQVTILDGQGDNDHH